MIAFAAALFLLSHSATPAEPAPTILPDAPSASLSIQPPTQAPPPSAPANPPQPTPQWSKVESLHPGDTIAVAESGRRDPKPCRFDDATDDTLTCIAYPLHSPPRRIVYPIQNIEAVYTEEWSYGNITIPLLIGAGIGGILGGAICNQGDAGIIATCALLGAGIGMAVAAAPPPIPLPPQPHLKRHLIYHAP